MSDLDPDFERDLRALVVSVLREWHVAGWRLSPDFNTFEATFSYQRDGRESGGATTVEKPDAPHPATIMGPPDRYGRVTGSSTGTGQGGGPDESPEQAVGKSSAAPRNPVPLHAQTVAEDGLPWNINDRVINSRNGKLLYYTGPCVNTGCRNGAWSTFAIRSDRAGSYFCRPCYAKRNPRGER